VHIGSAHGQVRVAVAVEIDRVRRAADVRVDELGPAGARTASRSMPPPHAESTVIVLAVPRVHIALASQRSSFASSPPAADLARAVCSQSSTVCTLRADENGPHPPQISHSLRSRVRRRGASRAQPVSWRARSRRLVSGGTSRTRIRARVDFDAQTAARRVPAALSDACDDARRSTAASSGTPVPPRSAASTRARACLDSNPRFPSAPSVCRTSTAGGLTGAVGRTVAVADDEAGGAGDGEGIARRGLGREMM